jgi:hypothetical protein
MHVEQVLGDVPPAERCKCAEKRAAKQPGASNEQSFWKRLLG